MEAHDLHLVSTLMLDSNKKIWSVSFHLQKKAIYLYCIDNRR